MDANFEKLNKKFKLDNDTKFNFDVENLRKDFAIENMQIADEDIGLLKRFNNQEITLDEMIGQIKTDALNENL